MPHQPLFARYADLSIKTKIYIPFVALIAFVTLAGSWEYMESRNAESRLTAVTQEREQLLDSASTIPNCLDGLSALLARVGSMTQIIPAGEIRETYGAARTCTASSLARLKSGQLAKELADEVSSTEEQIGRWFAAARVALGLEHGSAVPAWWAVEAEGQEAHSIAGRLILSVSAVTTDAEHAMHEQMLSGLGMAFLLAFLTLAMLLLTSIYQTRTIVAPLIRLKNTAEAVVAGKSGAAFSEAGRRDEIGALSTAICKMHGTLAENVERITQLAYGDGLTGLANRACAQRDLVTCLAEGRKGKTFALVHLDLDNFKRVNDTLGHAAGDDLLSTFGERLRFLVEETGAGKAYRWGGDEFLVIVDDQDICLAEMCSELVDVLGIPVECAGSEVNPTASLGVARYPEDGESVDALMVYADIALYKAKESGRDGFHFFSKELKQQIDEEARIERQLRSALTHRQLFLAYQPQVDVESHKVTGIECLLRWRHPENGVQSPDHFLHVAEACRLAPEIGRYVLDESMGAARKWMDAGFEFGRVAVNVSPQHVKVGTIFDDFTDAMSKHGVTPKYVAAEVVESILLDAPSGAQTSFIERLHNLGVHMELDDFGTGYASLSHLSSLPIDGFKIDKTFIDRMLTEEKIGVVVQSLVTMARLMQITLVCEGVETQEQCAYLQNCGQCSIQGYYFARPMEFNEMTAWLQDRMTTNAPIVPDPEIGEDSNVRFLPDNRRV